MMPQMTMRVNYKDPPKEGAKNWKISDGKARCLVAPELEGQFNVGTTYTFEYRDITVKGNALKVFDKMVSQAPSQAAVVKAGNGKGEVDIRSLLGTGHMYPNGVPSKAQILRDLWELHDAVDAFNRGIRPGPMEAEKFAKIRKTIDDGLYNKYAENEDPSNGFGEFED